MCLCSCYTSSVGPVAGYAPLKTDDHPVVAYRARITYGPILGRDVQPTSDVRAMLAQVREPLLSVLQISPEFRPAYDPLLRMATAIGATDVAAARTLLTELQHVQPLRPEAAQVLRELPDASR